MIEQPKYALAQKGKRALIPKFITLITLSIIFYLGILINLALLDLRGSQETIVKSTSFILIAIIFIIGTYLSIKKAHTHYVFYNQFITYGKNRLFYTSITNTNKHQNLLDKIFKTYQIKLTKDFHLRHISSETDLEPYLNQLIQYARSTS